MLKKSLLLIIVVLMLVPAGTGFAQENEDESEFESLMVNNWCNWPEDSPKKNECTTLRDWMAGWYLGWIEGYAENKCEACEYMKGLFPEFECDKWFVCYVAPQEPAGVCGDFESSNSDGDIDEQCTNQTQCENNGGWWDDADNTCWLD